MAGEGRSLLAPFRALGSVLKHEGAYELTKKFFRAVRHEGIGPAVARVRVYRDRVGEEHELAVPDPSEARDVLFVSAYPGGTRRYRCQHAIESLEFAGRSAGMLCFPCRSPDAWLDTSGAVVLQRVPYDASIEAFCARARSAGKALIFDLDDLLFDDAHVSELDESVFASPFERDWARGHAGRVGRTLALCDVVTVSTERLREAVLARFGALPVVVLPNVVSRAMQRDFERAVRAQEDAAADAPVRVGFFSGTPTHDDAFASIAPALDAVLRARPSVRLVLTGPVSLPTSLSAHESRVERRPLQGAEAYPTALRDVDVHVAPLRENMFDECKSALKWLEAALVGRPLVASAQSAYREVIDQGRTGFTCRDTDDWTNALMRLVDDRAARTSIGDAARREVLDRWTTQSVADAGTWEHVLQRVQAVAR